MWIDKLKSNDEENKGFKQFTFKFIKSILSITLFLRRIVSPK